MIQTICVSAKVIQQVLLSLMFSGMLVLGAIVAPIVFKTLTHHNAVSIMTTIFSRFDRFLLVSLSLYIAIELLFLITNRIQAKHNYAVTKNRQDAFWIAAKGIALLLLTASLLYTSQVLNPQIQRNALLGIQRTQNTLQSKAMDQTHKLSEKLYRFQCFDALFLFCLSLAGYIKKANFTTSYKQNT